MSRRILIVEDHAVNREMLAELLTFHGYEVLTASTAAEGIARAQQEPLDAILMDVGLPDMDGIDATRCLGADARTAAIPVLAVTAHALEPVRRQALDAGCVDCITKPIDTRSLLHRLEQAILRRSQAG